MKFFNVFYKDVDGIYKYKEFTSFYKALEFARNAFSGSESDGFSIECVDESCRVQIPFNDEILDIFVFLDF